MVNAKKSNNELAISLFCSGGIADLALRTNGIRVIVANELLEERAKLYRHNFPESEMIVGDIWEKKDEIVRLTKKLLQNKELDFVFATPPCQGMSKNGQGKLLRHVREGKRPKIDPRNRLIIPTLDVIIQLKPRTIVFENVPEMENTIIDDERGRYVNVIDYIKEMLGDEYVGKAEVVEFADYGIPQRRKRLITVLTKNKYLKERFLANKTLLPERTHTGNGSLFLKKWLTVRDVIADLPLLDARDKESAVSKIPYHYVPVLDKKKYFWVSNTPPEKGAFDNQCINPECKHNKNTNHGSKHDENGINRANTTTPLYCTKCGSLLPRPYVIKNGKKKIMSGYTSAYKRMRWDLPASTLTTNLSYPSSDHKLHPEQNRVLSLYEAFRLHTLDKFDYEWKDAKAQKVKDTLITDTIGESIPPEGVSIIFKHLLSIID